MHYATCTNCAADKPSCARRAEIQALVKGAGFTSAKFRCDSRLSLYRPGQRVQVSWLVGTDSEYPDLECWPATVIVEAGCRFVIQVDDVNSDCDTPARSYLNNQNLFAKVSPSRLCSIDEPDRGICGFCGGAPAPGSKCPERNIDYWPNGADYSPLGCILTAESTSAPQ